MAKYEINNNISSNNSSNNSSNTINGDNNSVNNGVNIKENINIKKIIQPRRISKEEIEKLKRETMRPLLKDRVGEKITCYGLVVKRYSEYSNRFTVINVVDKNGKYVADHIQLDFKENIYDYTNDEGDYVKFTGNVKSYSRKNNNPDDYEIDIIGKVSVYPSDFFYIDKMIDYGEVDLDVNKITDYLSKSNMTKIYDLLEKLRYELNMLTDDVYVKDFIYYYIINQYMLNIAVYNMYDGEIRDQGFSEDNILNLINILGSIIFDIKSKEHNHLRSIMDNVCKHCNVIQGVQTYRSSNLNPEFKTFCKNNICENISKKKLTKLWNNVLFRKTNFQDNEPCGDLDNNKILLRAYYIINEFI